jgi:hypothetical protein
MNCSATHAYGEVSPLACLCSRKLELSSSRRSRTLCHWLVTCTVDLVDPACIVRRICRRHRFRALCQYYPPPIQLCIYPLETFQTSHVLTFKTH